MLYRYILKTYSCLLRNSIRIQKLRSEFQKDLYNIRLWRMLKVSGIKMSVDQGLALAKPITTKQMDYSTKMVKETYKSQVYDVKNKTFINVTFVKGRTLVISNITILHP